MTFIHFVTGAAIGIGAGILLEKALTKMQQDTLNEKVDTLRGTFGEPMCTTVFKFEEVVEWIQAHADTVKDGGKAAVVKISSDNEIAKKIFKDLDLKGIDGYLLMVIFSKDSDVQESLLVKYEKLDAVLEEKLLPGNGMLVVED